MSTSPAKQESEPDLVQVVDRTALLENILNQIIVGYCTPRRGAYEFMWSVILDTSVMALGAKIKVAMAIAQEMNFQLDNNALHSAIELRNAFAHHGSNAHGVWVVAPTPAEEGSSYHELWVLRSSGKISRMKRKDGLSKFNSVFRSARESLVQLKNLVNKQFPVDGTQ